MGVLMSIVINEYTIDGRCFFNRFNPANERCKRAATYLTDGFLSTNGWQWCTDHARKAEHVKIEVNGLKAEPVKIEASDFKVKLEAVKLNRR